MFNSPAKRGAMIIALAVGCMMVLAGCGTAFPDHGKPRILAAAYPFSWISAQIGGDDIELRNLTQPGAEPHDVELTPHQVAETQDADLLVYERDFQPSVDNAVDQAGRKSSTTVDVSSIVDMRHHRDGHASAAVDPHVWLDPNNMITIAESMTHKLIAADPENAAAYRDRSDNVIARLTDLDQQFRDGLIACQGSTLITSHAAFGYLTDRYGLKQVSVAGIDPNHEPSPAQLDTISTLVRENSIQTVFTEQRASTAVARTIADETGARLATLDTLESAADGDSYIHIMRANLQALQKANDCS